MLCSNPHRTMIVHFGSGEHGQLGSPNVYSFTYIIYKSYKIEKELQFTPKNPLLIIDLVIGVGYKRINNHRWLQ